MPAGSAGWTGDDKPVLRSGYVSPLFTAGVRLRHTASRHRNHTELARLMASLRKSFFIKARDFAHAGEASIHIQNLLKSMHLDSALVRRIAICCYEGEMNAVIHGGDANIHVDIETDHLTLEIADDGPGIEDIARAMQPGYSTASEEAARDGVWSRDGSAEHEEQFRRYPHRMRTRPGHACSHDVSVPGGRRDYMTSEPYTTRLRPL